MEHKLGFEAIKNRQSNCLIKIRLDFVKNVFVYTVWQVKETRDLNPEMSVEKWTQMFVSRMLYLTYF